jgi:hypothetical protein
MRDYYALSLICTGFVCGAGRQIGCRGWPASTTLGRSRTPVRIVLHAAAIAFRDCVGSAVTRRGKCGPELSALCGDSRPAPVRQSEARPEAMLVRRPASRPRDVAPGSTLTAPFRGLRGVPLATERASTDERSADGRVQDRSYGDGARPGQGGVLQLFSAALPRAHSPHRISPGSKAGAGHADVAPGISSEVVHRLHPERRSASE